MVAQVWLTLIGLLVSGITMAVLIHQQRSFGSYTERIERSNTLMRQSNELVRQELDRTRDENQELWQQLVRARDEAISQYHPHSDTPDQEKTA